MDDMNWTEELAKQEPTPLEMVFPDACQSRMPLESPEKPVQEFSEGGSYPTTGDDIKRTSEAPIEFKWEKDKIYNIANDDEFELYMERLKYYAGRIKAKTR